jgi:AGCS family alanine or glycine:cation symporter
MEYLGSVLDKIDGYIYTYYLTYLLIGVGLFFTVKSRFVQIRLIPDGIRTMLEKPRDAGNMSSFQSLMVATASRVGTGNIAGVTTAIVTGGPGAVFWMWLIAVLGGASAFVESTLAQIYKKKDPKTGFKGGPAYYIEKGLHAKWLGIIFAVTLILTYAFGFNELQSYTISSSFDYYIDDFAHTQWPLIIGLIIAGLAACCFFARGQFIGKLSSILVPIMAILYIVVGLVIFFMNITHIPSAFALIFKSAFDFHAIAGGLTGSCLVYGIKRGLFSNEAGMGSAPNAAASADTSHPVKQGTVQVISVYIDTLIICSTTAFIDLLSGQMGSVDPETGELLNGIPFVQKALSSQIGSIGILFVTVCITLFAFTSIIGNFYYAEANMKFISSSNIVMNIFKCVCVAIVFIGSIISMEIAWSVADIIMASMATINIIAIFLLRRKVFDALNDYGEKKKAGRKIDFRGSDIGIDDLDCWNDDRSE